MKRVIALIMVVVMLLLVFTACGGDTEKAERYCRYCGKGISADSNFCEYCGADLKAKQTEEHSETAEATVNYTYSNNEYEEMLEKSRQSISPYLEYIPQKLNSEGRIELPKELTQNKDSVFFLGMTGTVSYYTGKYGTVNKLMWGSYDFYTYEENTAIADMLTDYFGTPPVVKREQYGQYNDTNYYWTDESVPCTVILYTSIRANHEDKTDRIEIYWDMGKDIPD